jgi:alpha-L-rhamnosidase
VAGGLTIGTDVTWRCAPGAIRYADLQMGEYADARLATDGWDEPGFDDSGWDPVLVSDQAAALVAQPDEPVRVMAELAARTVQVQVAGPAQTARPAQIAGPAQIADFGQNVAGRVRLTVRDAPPGRRIQIRHGEVLDGPRLYTENLRSAEATDVYITRGRPVEVFEPQFTVHGFRYAEITGHPFADGDVVARVLHSDTPWTGAFSCSDPLINQIAANIGWSQRGNFVAVPTDCPQRDERQGWLADAQVFLPTACRHADVAAFFARWLRDVRDGQRHGGAFGDIAPMIGVRPESAPGWGDAGVLIPWQLWREYGDRRTLELSYPGMVAWIDHIARHNPSLLWRNRTGNNYGDWLHVGQDTPRDLVATAYFARSARVVADASRVLGADAGRFEDLADRIAAAFAAQFVAADGTVGNGTQTGYLLALGFGLVPADRVGAAAAGLAAQVTGHGPQAGFLGLPLLCPVLAAQGRADLAYAVLRREDYPSWGYEVRHGATTIWERWDGWTAERGFAPAEMNSFNHYALGAVGDWLYGGIAGIGQASAGYRDIVITPVLGGGLTWAQARQETVRGVISSSWQRDGDRWRLEVELPPGPDSVLIVPAGDGGTSRMVVESGRHAFEVDLRGSGGVSPTDGDGGT